MDHSDDFDVPIPIRPRVPASVTTTMPSTLSALSSQIMIRGKAGQTSRVCLAGVFFEQKSRKLRRSGDPKTIRRQRRHTCTSVCHPSIRYASRTKKSNISSRASSGSMPVDITWPASASHRVSQQSSRDVAQTRRTYFDIGQLISRQSNDMHGCLQPTSFPNGNLLESMTQGVKKMM